MAVHSLAGVQLETVSAVAQELLQVVEPVAKPGFGFAGLAGQAVLFYHAQVGVYVEPEAQLVSKGVHTGDKAAAVLAVDGLVGIPVRLAGELLVVPLLVGGPVIIGLHPLRLNPHHIHRVALLHKLDGLVHKHKGVCVQVGAKAAAISPSGQQIVVARNLVVTAQQLHHIGACHQVKISILHRAEGNQIVFLANAAVKKADVGGVVQKRPAFRGHHKGVHVLRIGIGGEDAQYLAPVLDVPAAHASAAIQAGIRSQAEPQGAGALLVGNVHTHIGIHLPVVAADDIYVLVQIAELLVVFVGKGGKRGIAAVGVAHRTYHCLAVGAGERHLPAGLVYVEGFA